MIIGSPDDSMEKLFDELLEHLQQFDKRTSNRIQRQILREAIRPATRDLRTATREAYTPRTGRYKRSVRMTAKGSRRRPGIQYATYGWSNKGIKPAYYGGRRKLNGEQRERPQPVTYIGLWGDLGTKRQPARHIFREQWQSHKKQIEDILTEKIRDIMRQAKISK